MTFSNFASRLKGVIDADSNTATFTEQLFEKIVDGNNLPSYSPSTFKAYYNGSINITRIAQKIAPYIDQSSFESYIDILPDGTRDILCEIFKDIFSDANHYDISEKLGELFVSIIAEATKNKKRTFKGAKESHLCYEFKIPTDTVEFFNWCFSYDSPIKEIHMAFYTGIAWLTNSKYARLFNMFKNLDIPVKVIICSSSDNVMESSEKVCIPIPFDEALMKWKLQCKSFKNIDLHICSKTLLHRTYIIHFKDGSGIVRTKDYTYAYSEIEDHDHVDIFTSKTPVYKKYDKEFDYLFFHSHSINI